MSDDCKINVILDLDNTIINALEDKDRKRIPYELSNKFKFVDYIPFFRIYARPYLQKFLDYLFENHNVAIMTAAEKDYALFIIENFILIKPERKLSFVFYRYQVDLSRDLYSGVKDMRIIWELFNIPGFHKYNTVIIDDLDLVYQTNPFNTIRIPGFFIVDEETNKVNPEMVNDEELLNIIEQLQYLKENYETHHCRWMDAAILDFQKKKMLSKKWINNTEGAAPPLSLPEPELHEKQSDDEYRISDVEAEEVKSDSEGERRDSEVERRDSEVEEIKSEPYQVEPVKSDSEGEKRDSEVDSD